MWYAEILLMIYVMVLFCSGAFFSDLSSTQYQVDAEAVRLASCLMQVQERSRNYRYLIFVQCVTFIKISMLLKTSKVKIVKSIICQMVYVQIFLIRRIVMCLDKILYMEICQIKR